MNDFLLRLLDLVQSMILRPLIWLWPLKWAVVEEGSRAVRFTCGIASGDLSAGLHFATTGQELKQRHCRSDWVQMTPVKTLTRDGVPIQVVSVVRYGITNLKWFFTKADNSIGMLCDLAEGLVCDHLTGKTYADFQANVDGSQDELLKALAAEAGEYGVHPVSFRFQSIEHLDPQARAAMAACVSAKLLKQAFPNATQSELLAAVAPSIAYTVPASKDELVEAASEE